MKEFDRMIGKKLKEIYIGKGKNQSIYEDEDEYIKFVFEDSNLIFRADGDWCSETWFADVIGVRESIDSNLVSVNILDLPDIQDKRTRQESDIWYGFRLNFDMSTLEVIFRNSSNGYYGGSLIEISDETLDVQFKKLNNDFQG